MSLPQFMDYSQLIDIQHISHPNITPLLSYFTTKNYHALVLPYLPGGDLLGLVNSDAGYDTLSESAIAIVSLLTDVLQRRLRRGRYSQT